MTPQDIDEKNIEFDARYHDIRVLTRYDGYIIINIYRDEGCHEAYHYYQNSIDLANCRIEGLDNQGELDTSDNGPGRIHLSNIKYRSLQEALKWLQYTGDPDFISYKGLSIGDFQPRSLSEKDITHEETKKTILEVIRVYKNKKLETNEHLTPEEENGRFSFLSGSNEFTQIMVDTTLGKEKLYFLGNYFPDRRPTGVELHIQDGLIKFMNFPLEQLVRGTQVSGQGRRRT